VVMDTGGIGDGGGGEGAGEEPDPLLGRNVGRKFVLEKQLGAGAMGAVYRARQTALEKVVAIKVMHGELARDPMFAARFHREAKAASRLDHPNSIRILDYGQDDDGLLYIAMEYLDGRDLSHLIVQDWPLSNARIVDLLSQALGAIAVAHDMGITHRDLKPENIMVLERRTDDGALIDVVKVCDFGIAKVAEPGDEAKTATQAASSAPGRGKLTTAGLVIGTPAYMSPEQGRGEPIDGRSDLYSMGVILYQLLTGQLPFDAPSAIGLVVKHQTEIPLPPSSIRSGIDPHLEAVCLKALLKPRGDRYQTARELRSAIRVGLEGSAGPMSRDLGGVVPPIPVSAPRLSEPEIAVAKTELQMVAAPTAPAAVLDARVERAGEVEAAPRKGLKDRGLVVVGVALVAVAGFVGWRQASPVKVAAHDIASTGSVESVPAVAAAPVVSAKAASPVAVVAAEPSIASATPPVEPPPQHAQASAGGHVAAPTYTPKTAPPPEPEKPAATVPPPPPPVEAPVPPVATVVAPPPPTPATPPPAPFDPSAASVTIGGPRNLDHTTGTDVNAALAHMSAAISACYISGLRSLGAPVEGSGKLHIETDDDGNITRASVTGAVRGGIGACIEGVATRANRLRGVDTGAASADVPLEFKAR